MKHIIFNIVIVAGIFSFSAGIYSCTDLNVSEEDSIVLEELGGGSVTGDPTALLSSVYGRLYHIFQEHTRVFCLQEHTSDELIAPTRGTDWGDNGIWRVLHAHSWDATHQYNRETWNEINSQVYNCNQILAFNPSAQEKSETLFLRSWLRYHVIDLWGQLPNREITDGVDVNPIVYNRSDAFDLIEADLLEAIPNLPNGIPGSMRPKATKAAAYALLAKLYLNKAVYKASNPEGPYTFEASDMNKVVEYCDLIRDMGYSLSDNYFDVFSALNNEEIILTTQQNGTPSNRWNMTLHYGQNPSGWNGFTTLSDFYNSFDAADQRIGSPALKDGSEFSGVGRGFQVGPQFKEDGSVLIDNRTQIQLNFTPEVPLLGATTANGIRVIKYHPSDAGEYILLRYGDVHLMKVEAIHRGASNGDASALDLINELRTLRGEDELSTLSDEEILAERGRELYWENWRRSDQIRFGTFSNQWQEKTNEDKYRVLFPIPQQALDSNPNFVQNAGY
ncbi:RagB/SusD family nutrient uptake outer membrane protein [Membranihabitans marinus]|uniref:RagB/SusD family nutrient uptake outer membrane protein n=1 Tax=Membranihabitans marinus TaxID=1227546 RepID=UPI001F1FEB44|nr:RagB/SusD family nutrient uptake outer membrane protein [Membranihabitans marinus]